MIRVNILSVAGAEIGYIGELVFSKVFQNAARGSHVAMLIEGMYTAPLLKTQTKKLPLERPDGVYSRHVLSKWPIHKSWFVPAVVEGTPKTLINPPKGVVKYIGRDLEGSYLYLLSLSLWELYHYVTEKIPPTLLEGYEVFNEWEIQIATEIFPKLETIDSGLVVEIIEALKDVDFLLIDGGAIYHIEVKTTKKPIDLKLRKKREVLQKRQRVLEKLGLRPALAVVVPRENWEVEIKIEKI